MSNESRLDGGCLCGAVRFTAHDVETAHHACHCSMCRRWAGSPLFAARVGRFELTAGAGEVTRYASSDWAQRGFCRRCGGGLFYYLKPADYYVVNVGAFDNAAAFRLAGEIFIDEKPPGYAFAGDLPGLTGQQVIEQAGGGD